MIKPMPPNLQKYRDRARDQFRAWATDPGPRDHPRWVTLDTETTGLDDDAHVIEIGVVDAHGQTLIDTCVSPGADVLTEWADGSVPGEDIHGITVDEVDAAPSWDEVAERLRCAIEGRLVLIYNMAFDGPKLRSNLRRHELGIDALTAASDWHCVMEAYAKHNGEWSSYHGDWRWIKLAEAAENEDIILDDLEAHRALADAEMTRRLIYAVGADAGEARSGGCIQCRRSADGALCDRCLLAEVNDTPERYTLR